MNNFTIDNTIFVTVGAYPNPEEKCRNFIDTAAKFGVPITWISYREPWQGFTHHKLWLLRDLCHERQQQGTQYVFMLDSLDVVFAEDVGTILRKANEIYEPGTLLFNAEFDNHIYPYKDEHFVKTLKEQGCHLNSGLIVGQIETFITVIDLVLEIMEGIRNDSPKEGIAQYVHNDSSLRRRQNGDWLLNGDQFSYQIASIYYPQYFRLDTRRHLLAWTRIVPVKPLSEWREEGAGSGKVGQASIIHSSSTIKKQENGQQKWDTWVRDNILNTEIKDRPRRVSPVKRWKSAVGVVTSNSAKTINEWIAHQYIVGFDKIIVVLDKCTDDTFAQIQKLPTFVLDKVDVHNNIVRDGVIFQYNAYQKIYDFYNDKVEWLAMFDDDEFFYDSQRRCINDMLNGVAPEASQVIVPWRLFGHSNRVTLPPPPITRFEWFQKAIKQQADSEYFYKDEIKSIVRFSDIVTANAPHDPKKRGDWYRVHSAKVEGKTVTFDGREHSLRMRLRCKSAYMHLDTCLAHYAVGSMADFVARCERRTRSINKKRKTKWTVERFVREAGDVKDLRMMIYAEELRDILSQCGK